MSNLDPTAGSFLTSFFRRDEQTLAHSELEIVLAMSKCLVTRVLAVETGVLKTLRFWTIFHENP